VGQLHHVIVLEDPRHDSVNIATENARHVGDALAMTEGDLIRPEVDGMAAKVPHTHLEGHASAQRRLLEDHRERATR